jgi:hypothetical protein
MSTYGGLLLQLSIWPRIHLQRANGGTYNRNAGSLTLLSVAATPEKQRAVSVLVGGLVEITYIYQIISKRKVDIDVRNRSIAGFDDGACIAMIRLAQPMQFFTQSLVFVLRRFYLNQHVRHNTHDTRLHDLLCYKAHVSNEHAI